MTEGQINHTVCVSALSCYLIIFRKLGSQNMKEFAGYCLGDENKMGILFCEKICDFYE